MIDKIWRRLGPGILLAATSVGASHLVMSPQAGALFGFDLLWLILAAHLLKYPAFEFGPRYAAATGTHLLSGYARLPGPRGWALWMFLGGTILQGIGVLAGVVNISGCVLSSWTELLDTAWFSILLLAFVVFLLFSGGFSWLEHLNKIMMAILALSTLAAFVPIFPDPTELGHLIIPTLPPESIVLVAAILGWMPTGIDVSVWHSFWSLEKIKLLHKKSPDGGLADKKAYLKISLLDMRVGYLLSLCTGLMFVIMGAVHLSDQGDKLQGLEFAKALCSAYTVILGRWMHHVFMLTAFFAMFSTTYTVIDGFSRSFANALGALYPKYGHPNGINRNYRGFVILSAVFAAATLVWVGNPVTLVTLVAIISLAIAPILYALNLYCVVRHIEDPKMRPSKAVTSLGLAGIVFMVFALGLTVFTKLF